MAVHVLVVLLWLALMPTVAAIETVLVTATRRDDDRSALPYSVALLEQTDIQQQFVRNLPEALAQTPGVMVQKSANGQGAPFLRGFTGYRTLTLIDGIRYNNSVYRDGPNEYFSLIDFNAVAGIEIFGGPTSAVYGSDAIGGALNLHTSSSGYERESAATQFVHGLQRISFASSDDSRQSRTELALGVGQSGGLHLGYSLKHFGDLDTAHLGTQRHTGYGERAWDARFDLSITPQWTLITVHQHLAQDDVWRAFATRFAQSFAGSSVSTDERRVKDLARDLSYVRLRGTEVAPLLHGVTLTLSRQYWHEDGDRVRANLRRELDFLASTMLGAEIQFDTHTNVVDLTYGFDVYRDEVDSGQTDFNADATLERVRVQGPVGDDARYTQQGAYVQGVAFAHSRLRFDVGGRYTAVRARIGRFEDPVTRAPARFNDNWSEFVSSARASLFIDADRHNVLWGAVSEAFRAPNIADLSRFGASRTDEFEVAATGLTPEKFLTFELGLRTIGRPFEAAATTYHTRIRDFITSTPTGRRQGGLTEVSKQNSARGFVHGIEFSAAYHWTNGFGVWANVTWLEGELERLESLDGQGLISEPLSRIMPLTGHVGVHWRAPDGGMRVAFSVALAARADDLSAGDRADTARIPPHGTPGYEFAKFSVEKRLTRHFDIAVAATNVFNTTFRVHGSGVNEPGAGVDVRVTARF